MTADAATYATRPSERFEVGGVIARTFSIVGHNLPKFSLLAFIGLVIPGVISSILNLTLFPQLNDPNLARTSVASGLPGTYYLLMLPELLLSLVGFFYFLVAVTGVVISQERGTAAPDIKSVPWRHMLPLFGIFLLAGLAAGFAFVFLIVPGVIVSLALSVAVPARISEGLSVTGSLDRSWNLTRGFRWRMFLAYLVFFLIIAVVEVVVMLLGGIFRSITILGTAALSIVMAALNVLYLTAVSVVYCELRKAKEGGSASEVAAAFS